MKTSHRHLSRDAQRGVKGAFARIPALPVSLESSMSAKILAALGLNTTESGTYLGRGEWASGSGAGTLSPVNPATGEVIATVQATSAADYETIVQRAQEAYAVWRTTP